MLRNRELEEIHKRFTELLEKNIENIDAQTLNKLTEECKKLGDLIYLPEIWGDSERVPTENYFCPGCSDYSLKTVLSDKVNKTAPLDDRVLYKKTCEGCGHVYYVGRAGTICHPSDIGEV